MTRHALPVVLVSLGFMMACGRPPVSEGTLRVSVGREGNTIEYVYVSLEDERFPCAPLEATVTLNGVPVPMQVVKGEPNDGTHPRGFLAPGCLGPRFQLEASRDPRLVGQPFDLVIDAGGERVVFRSESMLTAGFSAPTEVAPGGNLRLVPMGQFFGHFRSLDITHPALARNDADPRDVAAQKRNWSSWRLSPEGEGFVASVPANLPEGDYRWRLSGLTLSVPQERCEGVVRCDASVMMGEQGTVTVRR